MTTKTGSDLRVVARGNIRVRLVADGWQAQRRLYRRGAWHWERCEPCEGHRKLIEYAITKRRNAR